MTTRRCHKCGRAIAAGGLFYQVGITIDQGFDGVIADAPDADPAALARQIDERTRGVPERLLEEDVHKVIDLLLCPRCRERFAANPLDLPLDARDLPRKLSDLDT
ncbi:MAG: hypothetical protein MUF78_04265 [Candidatus Edwardsbacteria bacterium]|nr:hypothetical protein [Candidatus Edwardsbacteria bacterium]